MTGSQQRAPHPGATAGFCLWLTGLPSAGKSTIARIVKRLIEESGRQVTLLDGDQIRTALSPELGFSRADRDVNLRRIGYIAAEVVKHGGAVICATVSPYRQTRDEIRVMLPSGRFLEAYVSTPLSVCEQRDVKGLYARARSGKLPAFTGVTDPYEKPASPELTLDTVTLTPEQSAYAAIDYLCAAGLLEGVSMEAQCG